MIATPPVEDSSGSATGLSVRATQTESFDRRDFRKALGTFATGVTVVTARRRPGAYVGLTANSFSSVSLDPPLVLWSQSLRAPSLIAFQEATHFVVSVLAADQVGLSQHFAKGHDDKFAEVDHRVTSCGAPMILGAAAYFECRNQYRYYGGDHVIFLGLVERYAYEEKPPLMFCRGTYLSGQPTHQT